MRRGAGDLFRVEVECDFELDMLDVGGAIARPFCLDVLRLKRAPSTGEGDAEGVAIAKFHRQLIEKSRLVHDADVTNGNGGAQTGKFSTGSVSMKWTKSLSLLNPGFRPGLGMN
jgi:hypothetical protein